MIENEKNETNLNSESQCPSLEMVSAYFDGELDADSLEVHHIKECAACSDNLKYFAQLADDLKKEMSSFTPDGFLDSVQKALKKRVKQEASPTTLSFPLFLKISAMFAGAALIILTLLTDDSESASSPSSIRTADPIVFLGDDKSLTSRKMTSLPVPSSGVNAFVDSTIDISNFHHVATGANGEVTRFKSEPRVRIDRPGVITKNVRQTWSVASTEKAARVFRKSAPVNAKISDAEDRDGNLTLKVVLTKKELAKLVRGCSTAGFKLLSPAQPQPEQKVFEGDSATKVSYIAVLVQE